MTTAKKSALGSGRLGKMQGSNVAALLEQAPTHTSAILEVDVTAIDPNPYQPRRTFSEEELAGLASSIQENGLLQPIVLRQKGQRYELLVGERRWRAHQHLGMRTIRAEVRHVTDLQLAVFALVENAARANLSPYEEACGVANIRDVARSEDQTITMRDVQNATGWSLGKVQQRWSIATWIDDDTVKRAKVTEADVAQLTLNQLLEIVEHAPEERAIVAYLHRAVHGTFPKGWKDDTTARSAKPFALRTWADGRVMFQLKRPQDLDPVAAQEIVDTLEPVLEALRDRAKEA